MYFMVVKKGDLTTFMQENSAHYIFLKKKYLLLQVKHLFMIKRCALKTQIGYEIHFLKSQILTEL